MGLCSGIHMTCVWPKRLWMESRWLSAGMLMTYRYCTVIQIKSPSSENGEVRSMEWLWPPTKERSTTTLVWSLISQQKERWCLPWWTTSKRSSKAVQRRSQGLFTLRDQSLAKMLPEEQAMVFHCTTAQLLQLLFPRHSTHHCLSNHASEWGHQMRMTGARSRRWC